MTDTMSQFAEFIVLPSSSRFSTKIAGSKRWTFLGARRERRKSGGDSVGGTGGGTGGGGAGPCIRGGVGGGVRTEGGARGDCPITAGGVLVQEHEPVCSLVSVWEPIEVQHSPSQLPEWPDQDGD